MSDRELVINAVKDMPENTSSKDIVNELLLIEAVKEQLARSERGEPGVPHEEVVKMFESWITK
jgi:predicted transcriptional regulator